jgi:hypothetical protein
MSDARPAKIETQRPKALIVIGVVGVIICASHLAAAAVAVFVLSAANDVLWFLLGEAAQHGYADSAGQRFLEAWRIVGPMLSALVLAGAAAAAAGLAASIGMLKDKAWSRAASRGYAIAALVLSAASLAAGFLLVNSFLELVGALLGGLEPTGLPGAAARGLIGILGAIARAAAVAAAARGAVFPAAVLITLGTGRVKAHYRSLRARPPAAD